MRHGTVHIVNGAHRTKAANNTGRKVKARVYGPNEKLPGYEDGGCLGALIAMAIVGGGALTGIILAARELLPL